MDAAANAYVTGTTGSQNLATANAAQSRVNPRDAFVAKLISNGSALGYFTYLVGSGTDEGHAIAVDGGGTRMSAGSPGRGTSL